ncbi:uncharacterized protein LOC131956743 [Physella acuta]|uniref:uncharacterized protein LOC131956743 n=1 Tax=Physella acuta TaxID=109671 RepID=UPI0027DCD381|nr:uncharacterized protein LOC131956743 [Physella acuta]
MDYLKVKWTKLRLKFQKMSKWNMSTLHSPRIQCCCCAIGVFAAMFGIFMLSAGICIVLNVTFMEVDTSGLPPELHNEEGKKVVGIILICVAVATLGLSATVSVVYFAVCNKKSTRSITASPSGQAQLVQQTNKTTPTTPRLPGQATPLERPRRPTPRSASQTSLKDKHNRRHSSGSTSDSLPLSRTVSPKGTLTPNSRHSRRKLRHPKDPRSRKAYKLDLDTHFEEESETTKVTADYQMQQKSGQSSSSTSLGKQSSHEGEYPHYNSPHKRSLPPVIVVDSYPQEFSPPVSTMSSECDLAETRFMVSSDMQDFNALPGLRSGSQDELDHEPPPSLPYNIHVIDSMDLILSPTPPEPPHHNILMVKSKNDHDPPTPFQDNSADHNAEIRDTITDLTHYQGHGNHDNADSRCESVASYNSAFSYDEDDPDKTDMELVRERMKKLLND